MAEWRERAAGWFPELADARLRQVTRPEIGRHHEFITGQLQAGVTVKTIHQRLAGEHRLAASYASLRRYVTADVPEDVRREQVRVLRLRRASRVRKRRSITGSWAAGPTR